MREREIEGRGVGGLRSSSHKICQQTPHNHAWYLFQIAVLITEYEQLEHEHSVILALLKAKRILTS